MAWWRRRRRRQPRGGPFRVLWQGRVIGTCASVSGLEADGAPVEHRAGTDRATARSALLPTPSTLVLRQVRVEDGELLQWARAGGTGSAARRELRIELVDEAGRRAARWTVTGSFPVKVEGPDLSATGNEVVIETLELDHEGIALVDDDDD
jgi:phage tail-like protein